MGKPLRGVELEFTSEGEVIVKREKTLTKHYFQSAEGENERTFIGPSRIATGDIGKLDEDGYLYLLGRKKELIITAGGYKIHPESVERRIGRLPRRRAGGGVSEARRARPHLCHCVERAGRARSVPGSRFVRHMQTTKAAKIGDVIFADAPFSTENGMLRPNLKLDRRAIAAKFNLV